MVGAERGKQASPREGEDERGMSHERFHAMGGDISLPHGSTCIEPFIRANTRPARCSGPCYMGGQVWGPIHPDPNARVPK